MQSALDATRSLDVTGEMVPAHLDDIGSPFDPVPTGVERATLDHIAAVTHLAKLPEGFTPHPKLVRQLEARRTSYEQNGEVDWALAEAMAFGSMALEGRPVRISGGLPTRHVQPSPGGADRREHRRGVLPAVGSLPRAGHVLGVRQLAVGVRGAGIRLRLLDREPERVRRVGGAVRRLRQRGADHHRPVHRGRRDQVGPAVHPRHAAAARLRGAGPGALLRSARALPPAVRGGQPPGGQRDDGRPAVPSPPPPGARPEPQAARGDVTEVGPARPPVAHTRRGAHAGVVPRGARRHDDHRPQRRRRVVLCSGKVAWDAEHARQKAGLDGRLAVVKVEQLYPFRPRRSRRFWPRTRTPHPSSGSRRSPRTWARGRSCSRC